MHRAWYLVVAVSLFALLDVGVIRADATAVATSTSTTTAAVSLASSVQAYVAAISAAVNKTNFTDVYNASLQLCSAAPSGITDLGLPVRNQWYRVAPQDLANVRDGLTAVATRLLQTYKTQSSAFADLYDTNLAFQTTLLSVNDSSRLSATDPVWSGFISDPTNSSFYNLFMGLRKRRDFFKAAIDPTTLAASVVYSAAEIAAVNQLLTKPALPAGAPVDGNTVAIGVNINGGMYFLQAVKGDTGYVLFASAKDPIDPAAQFKFSVDFDNFGLQSTMPDALFLTADAIVGDPQWLPAKKQRATRLGFAGTSFSATSAQNVKFALAAAKSGTGYVMRSTNFPASQGYVKIDVSGDLALRVVDFNASLNADNTFVSLQAGDATPITFVTITDLHRTLGTLRTVNDVASRVAGYSKLLDGSLISTLSDFLLLVSEAQGYVDSCRSNADSWASFTTANGVALMRGLIQKFRANMVPAPTGSSSATSSTVYAQQNNQISSLEVSLNAGTTLTTVGGRFPDGSSIKGALLVIAAPNGLMLRVGDDGFVSTVKSDYVDQSAQFTANVDASGNVSFMSTSAGGKYLQAGSVTANVAGWLQQAKSDISRASCIRTSPTAAEKFNLNAQGSGVGTYAFQNVDSQGYLRVDADGMVRSVDATDPGNILPPVKTVQSAFTFIPVDSFIKQLSALRLETQDSVRASGYMAMTPLILTDQHVNMLLQEVDSFVSGAIKSSTQWTAWTTAGLDKSIATWLTVNMKAYSNRSLYPGILNKLSAGYVADATQTDSSGLSTGDVVVLQVVGQPGTCIQVQADGSCKMVTGNQYLFDPAVQFVIAKDVPDANGAVGIQLKSVFANNLMLRAPDIAVPSTGSASFLTDRLASLSAAKVDGAPDAAADFIFVPAQVAGAVTPSVVAPGVAFVLKRKDKDGYLKVGSDLYVRFFDNTATKQILPPVTLAGATKLTYTVLTSLQKKFAELRGLTDDTARVTGYRTLLQSVVTLGDLKNLLFELQYYIATPRVDVATYTSFKNVEIPLRELLTQISTMFANSLKQFDATVPTVASLNQALSTQLVQNIGTAFAQLALADKVAQLETLFASVSNATNAAQFITLFDLTMGQRALFTDDLLNRMKALYQSLLLNDFTKATTALEAGTKIKVLDFWNQRLTATVVFADILSLITPVAAQVKNVASATDDQKNYFVTLAITLPNYLSSSSDADRATALTLLQSAAYTYLYDRKATLQPAINALQAYVKPQNAPATYSSQLDALVAELKALTKTSPASGMQQFITDATALVNTRTQALDADLTRLTGALDDALWHPLVLNQAAPTGNAQRFDAQINALLAIVKAPIPFSDIVQNLSDMLDKNPSFADTDVTYFMARAAQLVDMQAGQKDGGSIDAAIKVLTRGSRYQVSAKRSDLDQLISQLSTYKASMTGTTEQTYSAKINDLKNLLSSLDTQAATRALTDAEVKSFFAGLQALVDGRLDGTPSQIGNLVAWLTSSVVNTSRLVFSKSDGISTVQKMVAVLQTTPSISDQVSNLQLMLKNHPQFVDSQLKLDFIEKSQALATPDARQQAASEKFDVRTILGQILTFAKANQFAGDTSLTTGGQLLDAIIAQLSAPLNQVLGAASMSPSDMAKLTAIFTKLSFATQVSELDRGSSEIVDKSTATTFISLAGIAVANRISGQNADVAKLKMVLQSALRAPGIVDDATKQLPGKINAGLALLAQPLLFSDYFNAINVIVSALPTDGSPVSDDTKNLLVGYAQKLADNLISSTDQNARNTADTLLKKLAFNQLDDRSTELLKICDLIEAYVPSEQVGQKYTQAITALQPQLDAVTTVSLPKLLAALTDLVNRRAQGVDSDMDLLKQLIDKLIWHPLVQNESGQVTLKALNALMTQLGTQIPAKDLIKLLSDRLANNQTFAPDDVTYFLSKAQALVNGRAAILDKALLTQATDLLNQASRYQMASKKADIDQMVALLQTQEQSIVQQVYISYGDRIAQIKATLANLDQQALALQLAPADAQKFLKDLTTLVGDRAQAVAANLTDLSAWLTTQVTQSRVLFTVKGAKDQAITLLSTLQQPVSYSDQYNFLVQLLQQYPNFSSVQMQNDFFDKCSYLVSDDGKKQAISEGFDYKKLGDVLTFARQNQASGAQDRIDSLVTQLNQAPPAGQALPQTYNDKLTALETAVASLQDTGSTLSDFVGSIEDLVARRMYGNDAELARLNQLIQKAQWNSAVRQSSQSTALLQRIQTALDGLNKAIFFVDLAGYLMAQSKTPLTNLDDQTRFVARAKQILAVKEQAPDGSSLDQLLVALKMVAFNQMQKNTDLQACVAQLDAYRATITQQTYVSFVDQFTAMQTRLTALDTKATAQQLTKDDATAFLNDLNALVNARSGAVDVDIQKVQAWLQSVLPQSRFFLVVDGAKDKATNLIQTLQQPVAYSDRYNFVSTLIKTYSTFSSQQMTTDFLNELTYLTSDAGKQQAVAEKFDYKQLADVIVFAENNQLKGSKSVLDSLLVALNKALPAGQIAVKTYNQKLSDVETSIQSLQDQGTVLSDFVSALEGLVTNRIYGNDSELARLNQLIQKAQWNAAIRQSSQSAALLPRIQAALDGLNKPIFFVDLAAYLMAQSKTLLASVDDQTRFVTRAKQIVTVKEQAPDGSALDQILATLKMVMFNQMQQNTDLQACVAQLDAYRATITQQTYVSFVDQFATMQTRLTALDTKATAQQLTKDDATAFLNDLTALVNARSGAVDADIQKVQAWLQSVLPQSRFFLVTDGAKDKATNLIQTLQQPVAYSDRFNFVSSLIKAYSTFSSQQMTTDFLNILTYLTSDAGKQQAVAENFDYKQLSAVIIFAGKNQLQASKSALDILLAALNKALPAGQVAVKTYSQKLADQETAIQSLQDQGTALTDFVSALEGLVASRLYGTDAELGRLNQLLQKAIWNAAIRNSASSADLLARITAAATTIGKPVLFTDVATYLITASKAPLVNQADQDLFIQNVQKLVALMSQVTDPNALDQVIAAIKVVAFNQLQKRAELTPLITQLDTYRGKMNQQAYVSFQDQVAAIQNRLSTLDAQAKAQQLVDADAQQFLKDLTALVSARSCGAAADIQGLATWLSGVIPQSRTFFVTTGAKDKGNALLTVLQTPVPYADQVKFLNELFQNYTTFSSDKMTADVLAKCDYLSSDAGKKQAQTEGFDYSKLVDLLVFAEQNQMLGQRDQIDAYIAKLKAPIAGTTVVVQTYNDKVTALENGLATLADTGTALNDYVTQVEVLVKNRLDGADSELARLNALIQKLQWNAALRGSANAAAFLARVQAALDGLNKPVLFTDLAAYLTGLSKQPLTLPDDQNRFIAQATKLVSIKEQATDANAVDQVVTVFKLVAYNQLQKRTELQPLIDQLTVYGAQAGQQVIMSYAQHITDLTARITNVSASTIDKFLADLTGLVTGRFEATVDQLKAVSDLVNQTSWLNIVRTDTTKGYVKQVAALVTEVKRVPSVDERIKDLAAMLKTTTGTNGATSATVLPDVLQDSFVQKASQLLAVKANTTSAQLVTIIQTLQVAIYNQVQGRAQELQDILNTFTRYQQTVQITGGMSFGDRVKQLTGMLPSLTEQGLTGFRQQVSDLFDARVDGTDDDIAAFKQLLQAAVWNNVVVNLRNTGNTSMSDDFTNWYNTVDAPIDFVVWYQSLVNMLQATTLPDVLQKQFMTKVGKLVDAIPRAKSGDLDQAKQLLVQASYNQLNRYKPDLDAAVAKLTAASQSQAPQSQASYADRIKALQTALAKMTKASAQSDVDAFIKSVSGLVDQRVDAINDDITVFQSWLTSNSVQNNEAIYFHQGGDQLAKLASTLSNPVGYGVRVQNLTILVQNNDSFTDVQKATVLAKVQLLVDLRAQAANENYALSDVVKMIQFIIDKRLDKTVDAPMIAKLNNAIYVLQSGSTGVLRLRYGQQIDQLKTTLGSLVAAGIPQFVAAVKSLVDSRVDGTTDQVSALHDWLLGSDVQANKVLFFAPQKANIQTMAATLLVLPNYADRYTNLRQLLQDYPVFDSSGITSEFMSKAFTLVSERGRAAGEKFDLQYVKDLLTFAIQNRLTNDPTSTATVQQYIQALDTPADQAVATGAQKPFAQRITDLQAQFAAVTQATFSDFVNALSQAVDLRVDATDAELTTLKAWLASSSVQNSRIVFLQGGLAQIQPLVDKLNQAITFAQRVDNLRLMIQNLSQFSSGDQVIFFAKVDKIIAERWRAAQENVDIENVVKLLQFAQANQFATNDMATQSALITTKITALRTAPDQQGPVQDYVSYAQRITNLQTSFAQIGSMQKDVATMNQFVQSVTQMVADRVDGSDTDRATLITFIRSRVMYHQLVYGVTAVQQAFQNAINGLLAPITFGELYTNFKKMLAVSVYSAGHKAVFLKKLQALADGRGDAVKANVDLTQLVNDVTFAKLNKFGQEMLDDQGRTPPDRNPTIKQIEDLVVVLQSPVVATLTAAVAKVQAEINNLSAENWAAAGQDQKKALLARLRVLANNVDATSLQSDRDAIDVMLVTARARVFKGDTDAITALNNYRLQVQQFGATSSGPADTTSTGAVSGLSATTSSSYQQASAPIQTTPTTTTSSDIPPVTAVP